MAATAAKREKILVDFFTHVQNTRGRFRYGEERIFPATIGMNEKGGMTDVEFDRYIENSVVPLFPDLADRPGKRVLLKVDSGPGRNGRDLMLKARFRGVYIYPGLPNATSVQQETDVSYRPFKNVVRDNLKRIASACFAKQKTMKLGQSTFGLIVYGGICPLSGIACCNAVDEAFNVASSRSGSIYKSALRTRRFGTTGRTTATPTSMSIRTFSVMQLNAMGFGGDVLRAQFLVDKICKRQAAAAPVTVAQTRECQEAIVAANIDGKRFFATGGGTHVTTDNGFIAAEIKAREAEVAEKEKSTLAIPRTGDSRRRRRGMLSWRTKR
jgi:hypothetical protein